MATIYTATATNDGFYMALATAADSAEAAREAFQNAGLLDAPADRGGAYMLADDLTARIADEDGDYPNDGSASLNLDAASAADALANPGRVVMLDSGANG